MQKKLKNKIQDGSSSSMDYEIYNLLMIKRCLEDGKHPNEMSLRILKKILDGGQDANNKNTMY